jgi:deazaflavin-dependent oxidoreductase (nitroreductase family)
VAIEKGTKPVISVNFSVYLELIFNTLRTNFDVEIPEKSFSTPTSDYNSLSHPRFSSAGRIILVISTMSTSPRAASDHQGPTLAHRLFLAATWILKGLLRAGIPMGPMVLLTVRGRKSGEPRTTPVDLFEGYGRSFLVSTHRQESSNWVRNLRAAGEGVLTRGHTHRTITVMELPPEAAGPVLKEVLGPRLEVPLRGFVLRRTFSVPPDAPLAAFIDAAHHHPVFAIVPERPG